MASGKVDSLLSIDEEVSYRLKGSKSPCVNHETGHKINHSKSLSFSSLGPGGQHLQRYRPFNLGKVPS